MADAARERLILEDAELASAGLAGIEIEDSPAAANGQSTGTQILPHERPPRKGAR
jgi:2-methylisocitrate lyase-like PEP mutase family enzyme